MSIARGRFDDAGPTARVAAVRGATTVETNDAAAIVAATAELLQALLERNDLAPSDLVSVIFTATSDLTAEFPAAAARQMGISHVALLCASEIAVPGALERCVRVLLHCYTTRPPSDLHHVYLGRARDLRVDLVE
jgi:chorismate mutase